VLIGVHGGPGSHKDFKHLAEAFNQKDDASCEFVRFDLPGYGNSEPLHPSLLPTADNYAETLLKAIKEADILRNRKAIVMGHSLGGHVAVAMASRPSVPIAGVALLATVCLRPHKMIGDTYFYWFNKWLGLNTSNVMLGPVIQCILENGYKILGGFPDSTPIEEILVTSERVSRLDWAGFRRQIKTLKIPVFNAFATNDKLIQKERFQELSAILPSDGPHFVYTDGGHNIQKTKCTELADELDEWIQDLADKEFHSSRQRKVVPVI